MSLKVEVYFNDAVPVFLCEYGVKCFGDAPIDAFRSWWKHQAEKHPEAV